MQTGSYNSPLIAFFTVALFVGITLLLVTCGGGGSGGDSESSDSSPNSVEEASGGAGVQSGEVVEGEWSGYFYNDAGVECPAEDANPLAGDTIYVSNSGSDDNSGADESNALKTITKALCNASPGQTIKIMSGTYNESVILYGFGAGDSPITISGVESDGVKPVLDGQNILTMGIAIVASRNIIIENLKFVNYTDEGVLVASSSTVTVKKSEFRKNGSASVEPDYNGEGFGIEVLDSSEIIIENSSFFENGPGEERKAQGISGGAIDTWAMENSIIRGNTSSRNIGAGILVENGLNVVVEDNIIEENDLDVIAFGWWDGGIWLDGGRDVTVRNNTIRNNFGPAIIVSDEDVQLPNASKGYIVEQNTISGNYWALYMFNFGVCQFPSTEILVWQNNITENNTYTGTILDEWNYDRAGQILCIEWPCGVNTPCI